MNARNAVAGELPPEKAMYLVADESVRNLILTIPAGGGCEVRKQLPFFWFCWQNKTKIFRKIISGIFKH